MRKYWFVNLVWALVAVMLLPACEALFGDGADEDDGGQDGYTDSRTDVLQVEPANIVFTGEQTLATAQLTAQAVIVEQGEQRTEELEWYIEIPEVDDAASVVTITPDSGVGNTELSIALSSTGVPFKRVMVEVWTKDRAAMSMFSIAYEDTAEIVNIPDEAFLQRLVDEFDLDGDMLISTTEAERITELGVPVDKILTLEGIEAMPNLVSLYGYTVTPDGVGTITSLDLSANTKLETLYMADGALSQLRLPESDSVKSVICSNNQLSTLDVSGCSALESLDCSKNNLKEIVGVKGAASLKSLNCMANQLTRLDLTGADALTSVDCCENSALYELLLSDKAPLLSVDVSKTQINKLDLSNHTKLTNLRFINCDMVVLNLSGCTSLKEIRYGATEAKVLELNLSGCTALEECDLSYLSHGSLWTLNLDGCSALKLLTVDYQHVKEFDLSDSPLLEELNLPSYVTGYPSEQYSPSVQALELSKCEKLRKLDCGGCLDLTSLNLEHNTQLEELIIRGSKLTSIDLRHNTLLKVLEAEAYSLKSIYLLPEQTIATMNYYTDRTEVVRKQLE
ncbi:MAG: hypothetical protein IJ348_02475 [Alistipes sp.]|nr:hypothetical protein [Alistipes sp.]